MRESVFQRKTEYTIRYFEVVTTEEELFRKYHFRDEQRSTECHQSGRRLVTGQSCLFYFFHSWLIICTKITPYGAYVQCALV